MSPEQAEGKKTDERTDVFAFGAVLYEMLSGRRAFRGDSPMSALAAVMREEPPPLAGVPHDLERVVALCLRKDPARRFQHIDDVKIQLQALSEDTVAPEKPRRRPFWVPLVAVVVLLAAVGLWWWLGRSPKPRAAGTHPAYRRYGAYHGACLVVRRKAAGLCVRPCRGRQPGYLDTTDGRRIADPPDAGSRERAPTGLLT